ncbi:hypothetical protein SAMN05444166_6990 [Singulisphaera sp. GP187]|uniref:hypothetical protein n=1 Tax=Singulisphaera sp. GP187 TaxID=1882752 RepID=UPI00092B118F|nr:hypothetical protein [Singulisphaera sp. GP187]SIO62247.1 hypothetical protein SAMN05444166_6990 [Singulisphaera sp. GP187]
MKRLVKKVAKAIWRGTLPLRRPFLHKFESYLSRCLRPTEQQLTDEANTLMEHVVRELVRLQRQVDYLQQTVEDLTPESGKLAIAGEIAPDDKLRAG